MKALLEKLKEMEARQIYLVFVVVIVVAAVVDYGTIFYLQSGLLGAVNGKVEQLQKDIADLTTNKQRLVQFKAQLELARKTRKDFEALVRRKDDIPAVLKMISGMANECGVKVEQLVPQAREEKPVVKSEDGSYYGLTILVHLRSGYHQFGQFISRLEKERVFWQLGQIVLVSDPADSQHHDIQMNVRILILEK